ncbi:hypothetical protein ANME2D_01366 [Candidatus Methanoperedens nitroreducens]|uniref:Uncharacterized protein n=1 Tax=Candidatus Methanoperedens nitratireducens TaxID=1392998 RepID=A0A062VCG4_9EURY|nr:hypothetical protein [Candidatus Methanoperedens nitroreducens]KCZ72925.1 hypothetical protein ANME2D_01366 [Candidatus Methanoperedens nitroreducens]MDJ1423147.1 hypothetical protein [Candidatus Methanoperedens sp.]
MNRYLIVALTDLEYKIIKNLNTVEGEGGEKLRTLLRLYLSTRPELRSSEYTLRRSENKKEIEEILQHVWDAYEDTDYPVENWNEDKINRLTGDLVEINALAEICQDVFMPANKFRTLFKMLLHDIATESRDMDEYSAACMATIQLVMEFGNGVMSKETIRDGTILINEGWMFTYATAMKRAREFMKNRKMFPAAQIPVPEH